MKTVSLAEALRSGKKFRYKMMPEDQWCDGDKDCAWSSDAILHAKCQIIEEPREIWIWENSGGFLVSVINQNIDECKNAWAAAKGRPVKFREVCDE